MYIFTNFEKNINEVNIYEEKTSVKTIRIANNLYFDGNSINVYVFYNAL